MFPDEFVAEFLALFIVSLPASVWKIIAGQAFQVRVRDSSDQLLQVRGGFLGRRNLRTPNVYLFLVGMFCIHIIARWIMNLCHSPRCSAELSIKMNEKFPTFVQMSMSSSMNTSLVSRIPCSPPCVRTVAVSAWPPEAGALRRRMGCKCNWPTTAGHLYLPIRAAENNGRPSPTTQQLCNC